MSEQKLSEGMRLAAENWTIAGPWNVENVVLRWAGKVAALEAKLEAMGQLLEECRKVINSVPDKTIFGIGGDGLTHWYLADELLSSIIVAQQEQEDE